MLFSLVGYMDALNRIRIMFIRKGEGILDKQVASFGHSDVILKIFKNGSGIVTDQLEQVLASTLWQYIPAP